MLSSTARRERRAESNPPIHAVIPSFTPQCYTMITTTAMIRHILEPQQTTLCISPQSLTLAGYSYNRVGRRSMEANGVSLTSCLALPSVHRIPSPLRYLLTLCIFHAPCIYCHYGPSCSILDSHLNFVLINAAPFTLSLS